LFSIKPTLQIPQFQRLGLTRSYSENKNVFLTVLIN